MREHNYYPGFGASDADMTAQDAAQTLMSAFAAGTVTADTNNDVTNFQAAYNNSTAGINARIKVDGLYGAQTQLALQTILGAPLLAPNPLVANATGGSTPGQGTPGSSGNPVNLDNVPSKPSTEPNYWLWALGAVVVGAGGYYGYKQYKKGRK